MRAYARACGRALLPIRRVILPFGRYDLDHDMPIMRVVVRRGGASYWREVLHCGGEAPPLDYTPHSLNGICFRRRMPAILPLQRLAGCRPAPPAMPPRKRINVPPCAPLLALPRT